MTDARLARHYTLAGVLTLVDGVHGVTTLPGHVEARRQVALASRILFTKTDVAGAGPELCDAVAALNADAPRTGAAFGAVPPDWLFAPGLALGQHPARHPPAAQHTGGIGSFVLALNALVPAVALTLLLQALAEHAGDRLLRVKGLVQVAERPAQPALVQGVQHVFEVPVWLDRWPDLDHGTRLAFIAEAVPPQFPGRLLQAITAEVLDTAARIPPPRPGHQETMMTDMTHPIGRRALGHLAAGTGLGIAAPAVLVRAQPAALRIVSIQALTGPSAAYGQRARDGARLAAEQLNAAGFQVGGATGVVQIRVTPKTINLFTIKALSISGVTWKQHFLNHAQQGCRVADVLLGRVSTCRGRHRRIGRSWSWSWSWSNCVRPGGRPGWHNVMATHNTMAIMMA